MDKQPPRSMKCAGCGYRTQFEKNVVRDFASLEEFAKEGAAGRLYPHEFVDMCFEHAIGPRGMIVCTPITLRPGEKPGTWKTESHEDKKYYKARLPDSEDWTYFDIEPDGRLRFFN
jgi:hypothetical protein